MLPQPTDEESIKWLEEQQHQEHALGVTGIRELVLSPQHMRTYYEMHQIARHAEREACNRRTRFPIEALVEMARPA